LGKLMLCHTEADGRLVSRSKKPRFCYWTFPDETGAMTCKHYFAIAKYQSPGERGGVVLENLALEDHNRQQLHEPLRVLQLSQGEQPCELDQYFWQQGPRP